MRRTLTIWLVLGALIVSLFGNVLVVSAQADLETEIQPNLTTPSEGTTETPTELPAESEDQISDPSKSDETEEPGATEEPSVTQTDPSGEKESGVPETSASETKTAPETETNTETSTETTTDTQDEAAEDKSVPGDAGDESAADAQGEETTEPTAEDGAEAEEGKATDELVPPVNPNSQLEDEKSEDADADLPGEFVGKVREGEAYDPALTEEEVSADQDKEDPDQADDQDADLTLEDIPAVLAKSPTLQAVKGAVETTVDSFDALKTALAEATGEVVIVISKSFEITETLTIQEDQNITLTAQNAREAEGEWKPVEQPADYAEEGEEKQREIIEEARQSGEEALSHAEAPLPDEATDIIIKRAESFLNNPLFRVYGTLTLGTDQTALYVDGNKDVKTAIDGGVLFEVGKGGDLTLKNGVLMHVNNGHGYSAPVVVKDGGTFTMDGGRISSNKSYERIDAYYYRPTSGGAVYVNPGGTFNLNNGLIDHNTGSTGAVFAGDLFSSDRDPATINMKGGEIVNNDSSKTAYGLGGGITLFPKSELNLTDGIIAGNKAKNGGGIVVDEQYIGENSNTINREYAYTNGNYGEYIKRNKAEGNLAGGLIYKNEAKYAGGGVHINSNNVDFDTTMLLDNHSGNWGGGVYVSFPPITQQLDHILISENKAIAYWYDYFGGGDGGGLWNCPTGFVRIGDGHSVYVFGNEAQGRGDDLGFSKKTGYFKLDKVSIKDKFYSHISPVTELENLIKFLEDGKASDTLIPDNLSYTRDMIYLKTIYSEALRREAWSNSKTFILGNSARNGGGFGSNANLVTKKDEGDYDLVVKKNWDVSTGGPKAHEDEKVVADIFIVPEFADEAYVRSQYKTDPSLIKYGEIRLNSKIDWQSSFADQQNQFKFDWTKYLDPEFVEELEQDQGLYFSAEALKARGLKYLVMERGQDYVTTVEDKPATSEQVEVGKVKISRTESSHDFNWNFDPNDYFSDEVNLYLYHYDKKDKHFDFVTDGQLNENNGYSVELADELLTGKIKVEYYGEERASYDWGADWLSYLGGGYFHDEYHYALILVDNPDGSKTLKIPYLWLQNYDDNKTDANQRCGFHVEVLDDHESKEVKTDHTFIITNYKPGQAEIQKNWDESVDPNRIPESVTFVLLLDGKPVIDTYDDQGKPIYKTITLTKKGNWKGSLDHLNPLYLETGRYTMGELGNPDFEAKIEYKYNEKAEDIAFWIDLKDTIYMPDNPLMGLSTSTVLPNDLVTLIDEDHPIKLNLRLDGKIVDSGEFYWEPYVDPDYNFTYYYFVSDKAKFQVKDIKLGGYDIVFDYYDVLVDGEKGINEWGRLSYDILLEKNERGIYTLKLPRLIYQGYPYEFFEVKQTDGSNFANNAIPHAEPVRYTFKATNFSIPTPPPENPPEQPPKEPPVEIPPEWPTRKVPHEFRTVVTMIGGGEPPIISKALIQKLPATASAQTARESASIQQAAWVKLVDKLVSSRNLAGYLQNLLQSVQLQSVK